MDRTRRQVRDGERERERERERKSQSERAKRAERKVSGVRGIM